MDNLCALILAAGRGTRFWPKSTEQKPKQFLNLINDKTMLQLTVDRIKKNIDLERIFIVVSEEHKSLVLEQIEGINEKNIIIQPHLRNTAPCIFMANSYISQIYSGCNILTLPSDHFITLENEFLKNISLANQFINDQKEGIITLGIVPSRPETGYGYIKVDEINMEGINKVSKFVEKPCLEDAIKYISTGNYLWNAGIFLFNSNYINDLYKEHLNNTYNLIKSLPDIKDIEYLKKLRENYKLCDDISFDYAIMEKINSSFVIPSNIGWDDIGTWDSFERYSKKDSNNNTKKGNVDFYDSKNNVIYGDKKKIILYGIDDMFLVDADDCIVISKKEDIDKVYKLKNKLGL